MRFGVHRAPERAGGRRFSLPLGLCVLLLTLTLTSRAAGDAGPRLQLIAADGVVLVSVSLAEVATWTLAWPHSVAGTPVSDTFRWHAGSMWLVEHRTLHLDIAGLGFTPGRGELRDDGAGGFVITKIDEPIVGNSHRIMIGSHLAPTTLWHAGIAYELSTSHPGVRARLEVTNP